MNFNGIVTNWNQYKRVVLNCDIAKLLNNTNYASIKLGTILHGGDEYAGVQVLGMWYTSQFRL